MAEPLRLQIIKAIEAKCQEVTGVKFVSRNLRDVLSIPNYPAILIVPADDDITNNINVAKDDIEWFVGLEAYVQSQGNLSDAHETFLADMKKKMAEDYRLDNKVADFKRQSTSQAIPVDQNLTIASSLSVYRVLYRESSTDPYSA